MAAELHVGDAALEHQPAHEPRARAQPPGASSAGLIGAIISGAFLAAMLAGAVNVWMARRRSREEERARIRNTFAAAFEAYTAYKEFPYAIRRRRPDEPEGERIRLSEALRAVQEKVNYYLAWTQAESADVGEQYAKLISEVRRIAGRAMHDAWNDPPRATDPEMNIPPELVDLSQLAAAEAEFMQAVRQHLSSLTPCGLDSGGMPERVASDPRRGSLVLPRRPGGGIWPDGAGMPDPEPQAPLQPTRH